MYGQAGGALQLASPHRTSLVATALPRAANAQGKTGNRLLRETLRSVSANGLEFARKFAVFYQINIESRLRLRIPADGVVVAQPGRSTVWSISIASTHEDQQPGFRKRPNSVGFGFANV